MKGKYQLIDEKKGDWGLHRLSEHNPSHYRADAIVYKPFSTGFSLHGTRFSLSLPGEYNLYNALSCIALLSEIGISLKAIAAVLPEFQGIDRPPRTPPHILYRRHCQQRHLKP